MKYFALILLAIALQGCSQEQPEAIALDVHGGKSSSIPEIDNKIDCKSEPINAEQLQSIHFSFNENVPSEGAGGYAYVREKNIKKLKYGYYAALGKIEVSIDFNNRDTFFIEVDEFEYVAPLEIEKAKVTSTSFKVCNGEFVGRNSNHNAELYQMIGEDLQKIKGILNVDA